MQHKRSFKAFLFSLSMEQYALTFYRDREEAVNGTKQSISENNEPVKDDATITNFVDDAVKPVFEEENNLDEKQQVMKSSIVAL